MTAQIGHDDDGFDNEGDLATILHMQSRNLLWTLDFGTAKLSRWRLGSAELPFSSEDGFWSTREVNGAVIETLVRGQYACRATNMRASAEVRMVSAARCEYSAG